MEKQKFACTAFQKFGHSVEIELNVMSSVFTPYLEYKLQQIHVQQSITLRVLAMILESI